MGLGIIIIIIMTKVKRRRVTGVDIVNHMHLNSTILKYKHYQTRVLDNGKKDDGISYETVKTRTKMKRMIKIFLNV